MSRAAALGAAGILALALTTLAGAAETSREVHGSADAFATPGVALAWIVLRAPKDDDTAVVIRIDVDAQGKTYVSVRRGSGEAVGEGGKRVRIEEGRSMVFNDSQLSDYRTGDVRQPGQLVQIPDDAHVSEDAAFPRLGRDDDLGQDVLLPGQRLKHYA